MKKLRVILLAFVLAFPSVTTSYAAESTDGIIPVPGMTINEDTTFKPGVYDFSSGDGITITADDITIDGNGAVLSGPGDVEQGPDSYEGIAIQSDGHSGITLKNISTEGFKIGLYAKNGTNWNITENDFSDNFTDPDYGWGDGPEFGAVFLERISQSTITNNKGNQVWNGLYLKHSDGNIVEHNDFSHTSNVSLKMWHASENIISDNDFSYGIRIAPGEVHARDSTSMLMESGSNDNKLYRNDFRHGGDGIFIRVLNGWVSTGNYFEENDTSYANNNAIESWSPGNTYVRNKANHSSYGFWLGGSDDTVLIENEVAFNGIDPQNAPEAFGNAGIAVVNGASSHFKMVGNNIHDNNGPGVAIRYNADYPAYHWVIQQNIIKNNKDDERGYEGHGIYLKNAKWLDIAGNDISGNEGEAIFKDDNVSDVYMREATLEDEAPVAKAKISTKTVQVGETVTFDASESEDPHGEELGYRWDLGDNTISAEKTVDHKYKEPGFYRVGLTVNNGKLADLGFVNVYVTDDGEEVGTDEKASRWSLNSDHGQLSEDEGRYIQGERSIKVSADAGTNHRLLYPKDKNLNLDASGKDIMTFWIKYHSEFGRDQGNFKPVVRLYEDDGNYFEYKPSQAFLDQLFAPISEQRYGWRQLEIPLREANDAWNVSKVGEPSLQSIQYLTVDEGPSTSGLSAFWMDGLSFVKKNTDVDRFVNVALNQNKEEYPKPIYSHQSAENSDEWAPLDGGHEFNGTSTALWSSYREEGESEQDWYGTDFGTPREINRLDVYFYHNPSGSTSEDKLWKPDDYSIEYWNGKKWAKVKRQKRMEKEAQANLNRVTFNKVKTSKLRVVIDHHPGKYSAVYGFEAYNTHNVAANRFGESLPIVKASSSVSQNIVLNDVGFLLNEKGTDLSDVLLELYEVRDDKPFGEALQIVEVERDQLQAGSETKAAFDYEGLEPGKQYAIAITQEVIAPNGLGDHYRWPTKAGTYDENFGKYVNGNWIDESGLGRAWLKLYTSQGLIDYSFDNPGTTGWGVGHRDEEKRWQTFTVPSDSVWETIDGSIQESNGWHTANSSSDEDWVEMTFDKKKHVYKANLFLSKDAVNDIVLPESYKLQYWKEGNWKDIRKIIKTPLREGLNTVVYAPVKTEKIRVLFQHGLNEKIEMKEFEVLKLPSLGKKE
ncbi:right-handed parallel beta-helix repeat-containing protein [Pseudalkalibacillus sp. R45]|uniref:right-handed parallel beta-helix repeat-containing protein n=1 Tax=Pseudalkalibacillus sp. R45 TaxID=3457433 RepID=UPI003FCC7A57